MEKLFKCKGVLSTGKFETDSIWITSPTGISKTVWLHDERISKLNPEDRKLYSEVISKAVDKLHEANKWEWDKRRELDKIAKERGLTSITYLPEWVPFVDEARMVKPLGIDSFWIDLTQNQMFIILRLSRGYAQ